MIHYIHYKPLYGGPETTETILLEYSFCIFWAPVLSGRWQAVMMNYMMDWWTVMVQLC